ncbi:DegT/DnrJ/EryC1/StrS aminotransferase family protein [Pelagibacterales bacterium SAG-MED01]|nr:DegT/DnrJ/EryC1/StrS aminotransferase family protein [Pelagibacterales bacterium SAG-MED01]
MNKHNFIQYGKPYYGSEEDKQVKKVLNSNWIGTGPISQKFEKNFSEYKKVNYAKSLNSCTAALHLSLLLLNLKKNDEVITTPLTFAATINSIILAGGKPVLVDIRNDTYNIDEKKIEKKITRKTKAILLVHFGGIPCDMDPIIKIANKYNLKIIEDCAHAIESKYKNKNTGSFGFTGCFSFYANKNITTGEGGMLICKDKNIAKKIEIMRLHGLSRDAWKRYMPQEKIPKAGLVWDHYDIKYVGLKYNMIDINAALGISQLKKITSMLKERNKLVKEYNKHLKHLPVFFQNTNSYKFKNAHHLFTIVLDKKRTKKKRDYLLRYLNEEGIGVGVNYRSVTSMSCYKKLFKWNNQTCKNANYIGNNILSLPLYPGLKKKEQQYIIKKLKKFFDN